MVAPIETQSSPPPAADAVESISSPLISAPRERTSFEAYRDGIIHDWSKTVTMLGVTLIPLFLVLDYFTMPGELLHRFAWYRGIATVAVLLQYFALRATKPSRHSYLHGYFFTLVVSYMIVRMTLDLGGFDSAYYAGLNLVIVAVDVLLPWRAIHSAINGLIVTAMYLAINGQAHQPFSTPTLINNLYFLVATVVIATAISHTKYRLIEKEFSLRAELLDVNVVLDTSRQALKVARDALWSEMEVAQRIQTALLPANRTLGGFEVCAVMRPADEVGGDYYDIVQTRAGEHWLAIGDVSGHGVESGLVMMMTQTSILSTVNNQPGLTPSAVFRAVNATVRENLSRLKTGRYMTLNVIRLHDDRMVVAGKHQDFLIWRKATGKVEQVSNEGCWVGVIDDTGASIEDQEIALGEGDAALLFTDGVTEATAASGEMFGEERLASLLARVGGLSLPDALEAVMGEVGRFQQKQADDITLMLVRRMPRAG